MRYSKHLLGFALALAVWGCRQAQEQAASIEFRSGELKIVQLTDIHYEVGSQESAASLERMNRVLDVEQPDMVVFTGDVVLCDDERQGWDEVLEAVVSRHIPWAAVLGNHDDEYTWTRSQIIDYASAQPYSLTKKGPESLTGEGNYVVAVNGSAGRPAALLYFMDSGSYSTRDGIRGYGWFGFDQIEWYRNRSAGFTSANGGMPLPSLAFFHIPLQEYRQMALSKDNVLIGTRGENECPGVLNTGMYAAMVESGGMMGTFAGHDHNNDYVGVYNGIALAYGRFSGSRTTYTDIGYGARVIVLKEGVHGFDTWIRTGDGLKIDSARYPDDFIVHAAE